MNLLVHNFGLDTRLYQILSIAITAQCLLEIQIQFLIHIHYTYYIQAGDSVNEGLGEDDATAAHCLNLPGKTLYLTPLLAGKTFRKRGNKDGAVRAFYQLEAEGLGRIMEVGGSKGTAVVRMNCGHS